MVILDITRLTVLLMYKKIMDENRLKNTTPNNHKLCHRRLLAAAVIILFSVAVITQNTFFTIKAYANGPSDEEVFNSMLSLNETRTGVLAADSFQTGDVNAAFVLVRPCIVQMHINGSYGSGTIYSIEEDYITIITNRHVLDNWNDGDNRYVIFYDGAVVAPELVGVSEDVDVGMIRVQIADIPYEELIHYRSINYSESIFDQLDADENVFSIGSDNEIRLSVDDDRISIYGQNTGIANSVYSGVVVSTDIYVTNLDKNMVYCYCYAAPGMSGGGMFDSFGHYIGMLTGGTANEEAVAIRLPDVLEAIEKITQS